jgi:pilus assembly protein CpaD
MIATARKDRFNMSRSKAIPVLLALGVAISSSPGLARPGAGGPPPNRGLDSINQPVVERTDYVLNLANQGGGLSPAEQGRLDAWFRSLGLGYGDRVFVDEVYGPSEAREDIARIAADYGLLVRDGAPITTGAIQPGSIRVIVSRSMASVPNCPHWSGRGGINSTSPNYGCAVNSNFAAMVADPSDLVLGQAGSGTGDAATAAKAIKVYRETPPTGTKGLTETQSRGN